MRPAPVLVALLACGSPQAKQPDHEPPRVQPLPAAQPAAFDVTRPDRTGNAEPTPIVGVLTAELKRSMTELQKQPEAPYFVSYEVTDATRVEVSASFGVLQHSAERRGRNLDVDVRVGDYKLDNTHAARDWGRSASNTISETLPIEDDEYAVRTDVWLATDRAYKRAAEQLQKVLANDKVRTEAEDKSDDFSHEKPTEYFERPATVTIDRPAWETRLRTLSAAFREYPEIVTSSVSLSTSNEIRYFVSTEGTRYQFPSVHLRVTVSASAIADDGMQLHRTEWFDVASVDRLPSDAQIKTKIESVARDLIALRKAPLADPYMGPAILEGQAAGVFFHEVFGHRIEGHRQKSDLEGQTFAKKVGQPIMPPFIDVYDDPTISVLAGHDLNGFYRFDDEGIAAQKTSLVEQGVLKTFLLARAPTRGIVHSNGHGRRSQGYSVVSRQGNLVVAPRQTVDRAKLRAMLIDQIKQQGKPYGLIFRELDGGFTMTDRFEPQSFKLLPIIVYRLYPDGREELVRGADLEGTPLRALADIVAAGDDVETFDGYCGAESGFVPVSASSPSLLVAHVEVAKKAASHDKPPLQPAPPWQGGAR